MTGSPQLRFEVALVRLTLPVEGVWECQGGHVSILRDGEDLVPGVSTEVWFRSGRNQWMGHVGIAIMNHPFLMVYTCLYHPCMMIRGMVYYCYTTHLWCLGGWFIIAIPTLGGFGISTCLIVFWGQKDGICTTQFFVAWYLRLAMESVQYEANGDPSSMYHSSTGVFMRNSLWQILPALVVWRNQAETYSPSSFTYPKTCIAAMSIWIP